MLLAQRTRVVFCENRKVFIQLQYNATGYPVSHSGTPLPQHEVPRGWQSQFYPDTKQGKFCELPRNQSRPHDSTATSPKTTPSQRHHQAVSADHQRGGFLNAPATPLQRPAQPISAGMPVHIHAHSKGNHSAIRSHAIPITPPRDRGNRSTKPIVNENIPPVMPSPSHGHVQPAQLSTIVKSEPSELPQITDNLPNIATPGTRESHEGDIISATNRSSVECDQSTPPPGSSNDPRTPLAKNESRAVTSPGSWPSISANPLSTSSPQPRPTLTQDNPWLRLAGNMSTPRDPQSSGTEDRPPSDQLPDLWPLPGEIPERR